MSRILTTITVIPMAALTIATPARAQSAEAALEDYREKTSVTVRCTQPAGEQIVVCGRRAADKWRVPFVGFDSGDPRGRSVSDDRNRLASEPPVKCGIEAFLRNCGSVGVTVGTRFNSDGQLVVRRVAD